MIKILGFKQEIKGGKTRDLVHFTASDAITETGNPTHSTWEYVSRLTPPDNFDNGDGGLRGAAMRSTWAQIEPAYTAWKNGMELPENGTALGAWPAISPEQAEVLRSVGLKTIEAVAGASEAILSKAPLPNMRELKRQAGEYLGGRDTVAMQSQIADLQAKYEAALEMLESQTAPDGDKPRRGRPPKLESEAA